MNNIVVHEYEMFLFEAAQQGRTVFINALVSLEGKKEIVLALYNHCEKYPTGLDAIEFLLDKDLFGKYLYQISPKKYYKMLELGRTLHEIDPPLQIYQNERVKVESDYKRKVPLQVMSLNSSLLLSEREAINIHKAQCFLEWDNWIRISCDIHFEDYFGFSIKFLVKVEDNSGRAFWGSSVRYQVEDGKGDYQVHMFFKVEEIEVDDISEVTLFPYV